RAGDDRAVRSRARGRDHREVLAVVGARIPVAAVVGVDAGRVEVDAQPVVAEDGVLGNGVPRPGPHLDASPSVEGDGVARNCRRPADGVYGSLDHDACLTLRQSTGTVW